MFPFFLFLNRSFSFLRHCCVFVFCCCSFSLLRCCYLIIFRSSTVFCQFSPTWFAFSVVLCLSCLSAQFFIFFVFVSRSFSYLRHCCIFLFPTSLLSYCFSFVHCISSILSDFVCFLCRSLSFLPQCSVL